MPAPPLQILRRAVRLPTPRNYFEGARLRDSLLPDNILAFHRPDAESVRPKGVSNHFHDRFELFLPLRAPATARIGDHTHSLRPGDCALVFPQQFHLYLHRDDRPLDWLFVTFQLADPAPLLPLRDSPRTLDSAARRQLAALLDRYSAHPGADRGLHAAAGLARFLRLLARCKRTPKPRRLRAPRPAPRDDLLERINAYVRTHLRAAPSIPQLAEAVGYSPSHVRAVFRNHLRLTLGRYIRESRLSAAAQLIENGATATAAARATGFDSIQTFSRAFKRAFGNPPRRYPRRPTTPSAP